MDSSLAVVEMNVRRLSLLVNWGSLEKLCWRRHDCCERNDEDDLTAVMLRCAVNEPMCACTALREAAMMIGFKIDTERRKNPIVRREEDKDVRDERRRRMARLWNGILFSRELPALDKVSLKSLPSTLPPDYTPSGHQGHDTRISQLIFLVSPDIMYTQRCGDREGLVVDSVS